MKFGKSKHPLTQFYSLQTWISHNALAYGYIYDRNTGVMTGSMYNVNGNFGLRGNQGTSLQFGNNNQFSLQNNTELAFRRSVDLVGETDAIGRNIVKNYVVSENINLGYQFGKSQVNLFCRGSLSRYDSRMENFIPFNAWTVRYGARGTFSLPANFGISTDFTIYTRRGYSEASLNTDNFVWNARLYWSTLNNQLLLMLDGFDLLHDLSNVYYSINAQARTETYTNVLPRYVLFHIQWKFHKQPKKH